VTDVAERSADVLIVRTEEQVVEATGDDRLTHLDATTTQALRDARPGTATAAMVLDANGNPLAMFDVFVLLDRVWLITPGPDVTDTVMRLIAGRTFLADARFAVLDHPVVRVLPAMADASPAGESDSAADAPQDVAIGLARREWSGVAVIPEPGTVRSTPSGDVVTASDDAGVMTLVGPSAEVDRLVGRLTAGGAAEVDADAAAPTLEGWRIAAGRPAWGREVNPPHLPEELGLLPTHVHLAKGCYPGQEAVARMWMLGRPRRRLARVRISGPDAAGLAPGWTMGQGRDAVEVTSVGGTTAIAAATAAATALAFVPGTAVPSDRLGDEAAALVEVIALIGDDPQPPGHDPAMRRRRDRDRTEALRTPKPPRIAPAG
jgi:folate-binding protein YgfZ